MVASVPCHVLHAVAVVRRGFAHGSGLDGTHGLGVHTSIPQAESRCPSGKGRGDLEIASHPVLAMRRHPHLRGTCHCTRILWMTRLKTAWGIRRTRYLRLCNRSGDPKSTTPGSSANNLVIVSLLTLRNLAASATV